MEIKPSRVNRSVKIFAGAAAVLAAVVFISSFFWLDYHRSITFVDVAQHRAKLIDGIESYWSIKDLENHLRKNSLAWQLEQGQQPGPNDWRPPFVVDTVTIKNYSHLGSSGELVVEFFNGRLIGVMFFPREADKYIAQLAKSEGVDLVQNQEITLSQYTRVWRAEADREKRRYVGWEDVRLSDEMSTWIKRYS